MKVLDTQNLKLIYALSVPKSSQSPKSQWRADLSHQMHLSPKDDSTGKSFSDSVSIITFW